MLDKNTIHYLKIIGFSILMLLNLIGTTAWTLLYVYDEYTNWWVFLCISICFLGIIINIKDIKKLILKNKK